MSNENREVKACVLHITSAQHVIRSTCPLKWEGRQCIASTVSTWWTGSTCGAITFSLQKQKTVLRAALVAFKDFPHPCEESAAHRETVYPNVPLPINTLSFCSGILGQEGDMFARTSLCRNTGMSEIKWPRIILWDSMRPCLASGSKGYVSPLKLLESVVTSFCAWHFIFHPVIPPFPLLTMLTAKPKCRNMIAEREWCSGWCAPYFYRTPWPFGCGGDYV